MACGVLVPDKLVHDMILSIQYVLGFSTFSDYSTSLGFALLSMQLKVCLITYQNIFNFEILCGEQLALHSD